MIFGLKLFEGCCHCQGCSTGQIEAVVFGDASSRKLQHAENSRRKSLCVYTRGTKLNVQLIIAGSCDFCAHNLAKD